MLSQMPGKKQKQSFVSTAIYYKIQIIIIIINEHAQRKARRRISSDMTALYADQNMLENVVVCSNGVRSRHLRTVGYSLWQNRTVGDGVGTDKWCTRRGRGGRESGATQMPAWNIRRRTRGIEYSRIDVACLERSCPACGRRTRFENSASDGVLPFWR